jgi:D-glycero-alpha-D-manno-heptose-7-phosphate kinase
MIITRTPFRISFVGGGTDFRDFYRNEPGAVVSAAINKYMYIVVNKRFDSTIRVCYSKTEIVNRVEELQHPIIREAMKLVGLDGGIEIMSIADVPAGTGLGSSGSFTVGLLNALYAYKGSLKSAEELAQDASRIEMDILGEPIGKQDQYAAAYGGLRYIQFNPDESTFVQMIMCPRDFTEQLRRNLLLFYTGNTRAARDVLSEQRSNIRSGKTVSHLKKMRSLAVELKDHLNNSSNPDFLGEFLHKGWMLKKQLSVNISSSEIDTYYEKALSAGALGGKIVGAGGGGFLLLYCPEEKHPRLREALEPLPVTEFSFEPEGSKIIYII